MKFSKRTTLIVSSVIIVGTVVTYIFRDNIKHLILNDSEYEFHEGDTSETEGIETPHTDNVINFKLVDQLARSVPKTTETNIELLSAYFNANCKTELEKARAIYIWLTKNIRYDDEGYNNELLKRDYSAEGVLKNRIAVCEGFSNLYYALGKKMNLQIEKIDGYSKGYAYKLGDKFKEADHAWNLIKINGEWKIFDATWGEGYGETVKGKLVSKKKFDEYWFNVSPYAAIFSHYPKKSEFLNITPAIDLKTYEIWPNIDAEYFNLGFNAQDTYKNLLACNTLAFPTCYKIDTDIKVKNSPKYQVLGFGKIHKFEFVAPQAISIAIIDSKNKWTYLNSNSGVFSFNYTAITIGELILAIKYDNTKESYDTFLIYKVKKQ